MYEYIKGTVEMVTPEYIVVENNGIGYQIFTPNPFVFTVNQSISEKIFIYQHVREDALSLFGFHTLSEKTLFKKLLNVSGIGPKGALAILAFGEPSQVIEAIENENETFLTKFPGVGKKTARQMILDLKGKLQDIVPDYFPNLFNTDKVEQVAQTSAQFDEAILALKALGYSDKEIKKISSDLQKEKLTTDQYIKMALKKLVK
ncbi:Holliday junction branch migration protein RuvA [Heyndrickxia sporothermodurans]|uniref:Holliday junction branch migration complex subunit RuvA n=1 Tax=Heyndrickxia sporothermodurans TaxID=46224 RepID=A0AB37H5K5_9BACI|nr:Holliday junction branch migration protein RuvA [Heyndrickxia sporothermodurans]MBL5766137.1 Holliday junction branch migration protein RuvA [Heyndrickxia sporothermodurans]MBL5769578.1 Holliday junction branch migration protein RuvA [Heyndrickxia sporothermodurans]MBL5773361.1 Holliday junction branch migration protein RuvA [Heyndrickxia sporothermodurans]MBL5776742.1 Holliday junction branch migration protein RuvA [Heyndrickxia sporothermodurans]MBL5780244.1 Holliday junction branch migra